MTSRFLVPVLVLAAASAACGGDDAPDPYKVYPREINLGFETGAGAVTYSAPVKSSESKATFEVIGLCAAVSATPKPGQAVIEAKGVGECNLKVTMGTEVDTIKILVPAYEVADRQAGEQAYITNQCGSKCHDVGAKPDNTSSAIAEHRDPPVLLNIRAGADPDGGIVRDFHKFNPVPDGIAAYVRSLPAKGLPSKSNFGDDEPLDLGDDAPLR